VAARAAGRKSADPTTTEDWCIPLSIVTGGSGGAAGDARKVQVIGLDPEATAFDPAKPRDAKLAAAAEAVAGIAAAAHAHYVKLNAGHTAFFRTLYDPALLARLLPALATPADHARAPGLSVNDRVGLVGDVAHAVRVGAASAADLVSVLWTARHETEYPVWLAIGDGLDTLQMIAETVGGETLTAVNAFTAAMLRPILAHVGWDAKPGEAAGTVPLLRPTVLRRACAAGDAATVAEALRRFDAHVAGKAPLPADLRATVYGCAVADGGRWDAVVKLLRAADTAEERIRAAAALGYSRDPATIRKTLALACFSDDVRTQDSWSVLTTVGSQAGAVGRDEAWAYFRENYDALLARFGGNDSLWLYMIGGVTARFATREAVDDITAFFAPRGGLAAGGRKLAQNLEAIRNRAWTAAITARDPRALPAVIAAVMA
jgi:puromycin-sensitive aminopeptidase